MRISKKIEIGDTVKFTVTARREGKTTATRKVVALHPTWGVGVKFDGFNPFWVGYAKGDKVTLVEKGAK